MTQREATTVLLERRWVVDDMPSDELLTMLAHAYGSLRGLIGRCHKLLGYELALVAIPTREGTSGDAPAPEWLDELPLGGRLPCMVSTHAIRRTRYHLTDGQEVQFLSDAIEPDIELLDRLQNEKPYGELVPMPKELVGDLQKVSELESLVSWYVKLAKGILRSGQDHGWFTYYFRKGRMVGSKLHMAVDAQGKTAIAGDIARRAEELDADAVVLISEVWVSPSRPTPDGAGYRRPFTPTEEKP